MAVFRETVQSMCWAIPLLGGWYFWVVTVTSFLPPRKREKTATCDPDHIKDTMLTWVRWMASLLIVAGYFLIKLRGIAEAAAAEINNNSLENEEYKAAQEELKEAVKAVKDTLAALSTTGSKDEYVKAIGRRNIATEKVSRSKPKEGLQRLPLGEQKKARSLFVFVMILFFAAGVCASVSFYLSLNIQVGCANTFPKVFPFVLAGLASLYVHVDTIRIGLTKD